MKLNFLDKYEFFAGVPDSQLKPLCNYLMKKYGVSDKHIITPNEGNAVALAAGYYLATGKVPVVYMQNSGIGNVINPIASLMNDKVYGIPCIFIVGWRGEPGVHDEPQHIFQGEVTIKLLEDMDIKTFVISKETTEIEVSKKLTEFQSLLDKGKQVAFIIKKDAIEFCGKIEYKNENKMNREEIIQHIVSVSNDDIIVSTTGKASRELFEIRERNKQSHKYDFLTVGSMGNASAISLGIALVKKNKKVWCVDGDGAALMQMGNVALIGSNRPSNLIHIVINNGAHETVGGMPTVAEKISLTKIASACGYEYCKCVNNYLSLDKILKTAKANNKLTFIEVKCSISSRENLGRPTISVEENKKDFMKNLTTK